MMEKTAFNRAAYGISAFEKSKLILAANIARLEVAVEVLSDFVSCRDSFKSNRNANDQAAAELVRHRLGGKRLSREGVLFLPMAIEAACNELFKSTEPHVMTTIEKTLFKLRKQLAKKRTQAQKVFPEAIRPVEYSVLSEKTRALVVSEL